MSTTTVPDMAASSPAHDRLARTFIERHPIEAARRLETAPLDELATLVSRDPDPWLAVIERLTLEVAGKLVARLEPRIARRLVAGMDPRRSAALLARLDRERRERILSTIGKKVRRELEELMTYPENSAGHLMDPRVIAFREDATVGEVLERLRGLRQRRVQDVFLLDTDDHLRGAVPIQTLILATPDDRLDTLVTGPAHGIHAMAPREDVIERLQRHRSDSLPVTDLDGRLLGVLRQDELLATVQEDAAEDLVTMTGAGKDERALSPPLFAVKKRLPWLQVNLLTAFLAAAVVGLFESTIAQFTALAVLLPVVAGQSGNTGAQALAVTMRGLALREIRVKQWLRVTGKELSVGALNGVAVAITTGIAVFVWSRSTGLALVIFVSMILSMTIAGMAGAVIPLFLTSIRQDPAQSSSIILTTVTDIVGFFSFLGIATMLSSML
jgi:magnesium transporter